MLLFLVINAPSCLSILPTNYLVIIQTFSLEKYGASHARKCMYVIYHIRYLFFMFLSFPFLFIAWNTRAGKQTHQHLALWTLELPCVPAPLPLLFPFIPLPAVHQIHSFWGPLTAVPIIHPETQHPHHALTNLYRAAKTQQEGEWGRGWANTFTASHRAPDHEQGQAMHRHPLRLRAVQQERERGSKKEREEWGSEDTKGREREEKKLTDNLEKEWS